MSLLNVSPAPHIHGEQSVKSIMYSVIIALIPALGVSVYFFGFDALRVTFIAVVSCLFFEWMIQKYLLQGKLTVTDGSAVITGILLAFNVPSSLPWWMVVLGSLFAIGVAKMSFGGLGNNPFNPALIGRVFLLISFPVEMTVWPSNRFALEIAPDAITGATPLGLIKEGLRNGASMTDLLKDLPSLLKMFVGDIGGSLGEVSALALLAGGIFLLIRKVITWHIPFSYIVSLVLFTGIFWLIQPEKYANPLIHLFAGGLILGAFFMATDMVTSPMSPLGMIVFGIGCGVFTAIIRLWGAYPEGVSFAILIMNAVTPLINRFIKPKTFGEVTNG